MYQLNLLYLTSVLATVTTAIPNPGVPETSEPDPRFTHHDLPHPNAEIHIPHAKAIHMRDSIHKRTPPPPVYGFYEGSARNFKGDCKWTQIFASDADKCHSRSHGPGGSFGPDKGVTCTVYEQDKCNAKYAKIEGFGFPGAGDCANSDVLGKKMPLCPQSWTCRITA